MAHLSLIFQLGHLQGRFCQGFQVQYHHLHQEVLLVLLEEDSLAEVEAEVEVEAGKY
jgi:hypothetical protein